MSRMLPIWFSHASPFSAVAVNSLPGLEERTSFSFDVDTFAGARIAVGAGVPLLDRERAEAAATRTRLPLAYGFDDLFEDRR